MKEYEQELSIAEKYAYSIKEAAVYFGIGETKLRQIVNMNKDADYLLWTGTHVKIKRKLFEKFLDEVNYI